MRKRYTTSDIIEAVKTSYSLAQVLIKLGLKPVGGNYFTLHRKIAELSLETSHFTKQSWSKGKFLKDFKDYKKPSAVRKRLIETRGYRCEECSITEWCGKELTLELDHIDGNRTNNAEDNLRLLCPNCHSQTPTWRNRKR